MATWVLMSHKHGNVTVTDAATFHAKWKSMRCGENLASFRVARHDAKHVPEFRAPYTDAEKQQWMQTFGSPLITQTASDAEFTIYGLNKPVHDAMTRTLEKRADDKLTADTKAKFDAMYETWQPSLHFIRATQIQQPDHEVAVVTIETLGLDHSFVSRTNSNALTINRVDLDTLVRMHKFLEAQRPDSEFFFRLPIDLPESDRMDFMHVHVVARANYVPHNYDVPMDIVIEALRIQTA